MNLESIQQEQLEGTAEEDRADWIWHRAQLSWEAGSRDRRSSSLPGQGVRGDPDGIVRSLCHTHAWFSIPLLDYIVNGAGAEPTGQWLPFRELAGGRSGAPVRTALRKAPAADRRLPCRAVRGPDRHVQRGSAHARLQRRHLRRPLSPSAASPC